MLVKDIEIISLKQGEVLRICGEYTILEGYVVCRRGNHLLRIIKEGTFIVPEDAFMGGLVEYRAQRDTRVAFIPSSLLAGFLNKQREAQQDIIQLFTQQLDLYELPVKERVMALLYRTACEVGEFKLDKCRIPTILIQAEIAIYTHCTREYLNSVRKALMNEGWLDVSKDWVLLDWERWSARVSVDSLKGRSVL
ncbi:Crp/Fnr family transcriptional regulator [Listeria rustica]|uniref:Crp/Fnr family transcriptional regulator n=1 Tax=Listeria rustica TaxID=2713503 RepID=A0A7W1YHD2_9LIST|nr:Crp/Fnr family transcriptional regulator [Listeria rustica]MBA3927617.1 Crp/Fnr family transcriptional regulator [Listeria rustica]